MCAKYADAQRIYSILGRPRNLMCVSTGGMICGYGADMIIMDDLWAEDHQDSEIKRKHINDWYHQSLETRLYPGGKFVNSKVKVTTFDWGNDCGISMEVRAPNELVHRQAVRMFKRQEDLTHEDVLQARAKLLLSYMRLHG